MEKIGFALAIFVAGGIGVTIGIYIASQIKEIIMIITINLMMASGLMVNMYKNGMVNIIK